ncbi:hypothetical protein HAALTHF_33060n [Vreelandella aquamarina]|nr:hypothetical protein HAALTHF_33060n [Halomonas axialensis]
MLVLSPERNAQAAEASCDTVSGASQTTKRDAAAAKGCGKREKLSDNTLTRAKQSEL